MRAYEDRGANAPPNSLTKPRERSFGRIFAARVWPGGHTLLVVLPGFSICLYLQLDLQFKSKIFDEMAFDPWLQPIDL